VADAPSMTTMPESLTGPVAVPEPESEPFWQSLRDLALTFQRCDACDRWIHPPLPKCPRCRDRALWYRAASGHGRVFSYTIVRRDFGSGVAVPFATGYVETAEGLRVAAFLVECPLEEIAIGMPVAVDYADYPEQDLTVLLFRSERG
jgi:uncharacterized protein